MSKKSQPDCTTCSVYSTCIKRKKAPGYWCTDYEQDAISTMLAFNTEKDSKILTPTRSIDLSASSDYSPGVFDPKKFDVEAIINEAVASNRLVTSDLKIPERDFAEAVNFYEFTVDDQFLNAKPYVKQMEIAIKLFAEWCPRCTDTNYFVNGGIKVTDSLRKFKKKVALLEYGVCPHCKARKHELVLSEELNLYEEMAVMAGQRGGKSALTAMMFAYITHRIIKMQRMVDIYGMLSNTTLVITFTAITMGQVKLSLWDPYYGYITESPWYLGYHKMLDEYTAKTGDALYKIKDTFILYRHRKLLAMIATPDVNKMRGATRVAACLDENSRVNTKRGLIKIKDIEIGDKVFIGTKSAYVSHKFTSGKKDCLAITSHLGNVIIASKQHKMVIVRNGKEQKIESSKIRHTDKLIVVAGGHFNKVNKEFDYKQELVQTNLEKVVRLIEDYSKFDQKDIQTSLNMSSKHTSTVIGGLVKRGYLTRFYRKGSMFSGMSRCYYTKSENFEADHIVNSRNKGKFTRDLVELPTRMTPALATLLGYLIADGSVKDTTRQGIIFATSSVDHRFKEYVKCFKQVFNINPVIAYEEKEDLLVKKATISYRNVINFLRHVGLDAVYSADKRVPWSVLESNRECYIAFLKACFICDGGISKNKRAFYSTTSPKLSRDIQLMCLKLGYIGRSRIKKIGVVNSKYNKKVGLHSLGFNKDISFDMWEEIQFDRKYKPVKAKIKTSNFSKGTELWNKNQYLVPIRSIKEIGYRKTYDLTIDCDEHVYVAEGYLTSNSIDEIGRFDNSQGNSKVKMNAGGVYEALQRSLRTVRSAARRVFERGLDNAVPGYFLNISSPSNYRDKISSLVRESVGSRKLLGYQLATWEMNPDVTREDLDDEFRRDPQGALCDYGAQPPLTSNPFISSESAVAGNYTDTVNPIRIQYARSKRKDGTATIFAYPEKIQTSGRPSILSIDAGFSNNSFALVGGSLDSEGKPRLDIFVEVMSRPGTPLNHTRIYTDLIQPLIDERNAVLVTADQWQSIKILQDIEEEFGISTKKYSLRYTDLVMFKDYILDHEIKYPKPKWSMDEITKHDSTLYPWIFKNSPIEHFILQCLTVQDTGSKVIKGENLTDDLFRAAALCTYQLMNPENAELLSAPTKTVQTQQVIGLYKGLTGVQGNANIHTQVATGGADNITTIGLMKRRG